MQSKCKYTIGMATYGNMDNVFWTIQGLKLFHDLKDTQILVIDNKGNDYIKNWIDNWGHQKIKYVKYTDINGTTQPRNKVFEYADGEYVLCIDDHVLLSPGALQELDTYMFDGDLIHGPMIYDCLTAYTTHMEPVWRDNMWGIWADVVHEKDMPKEPFVIPMHGLGVFGCRKDAWLGFNNKFRGFGGEEGYIHEKFRKAGRRVLCLPWLRWNHKFSQNGNANYVLNMRDRIRNYLIGFEELGLDYKPIIDHFGNDIVHRIASEEGINLNHVKITNESYYNVIAQKKKVLLIANSPTVLNKKAGDEINNFDGLVLRFNNYATKGYEDYVGDRTDVWVTVERFGSHLPEKHLKRFYVTTGTHEKNKKLQAELQAEAIDPQYFKIVGDLMNRAYPSTGAIVTKFYLDQGFDVSLFGFNFMHEHNKHHYNDSTPRGPNHKPDAEWLYFYELEKTKKIKFFAHDYKNETFPVYRIPKPCGTDQDISWYREPAHNAWYRWFGEMSKGKTILDVGSGVGAGMKVLLEQGVKSVHGVDVDERLNYPNLTIAKDLSVFKDKSFDVITCIDVIEHVVKDKQLFNNMKRIAREKIFITTPNYTRSKCGNIAHAREYSMAQFMNYFYPDQIWSASPDGKVHKTLVLERYECNIIDHSDEGYENRIHRDSLKTYLKEVPLSVRFNNTVDGKEWGHICGIFNLSGEQK